MNRREVLGLIGMAATQGLRPGTARAASTRPAGDAIRIGCIGTGGRCQHLMQALRTMPDVKLVAVCDIWDVHLQKARALCEPDAFATKDYHELLDRNDVHAVVIGSPDHWHVPMAVDACEAGKDVYVEKPLTHDLTEGQALIDAQTRHHRVVQVGTQQRSMPQFALALDIIKSGRLGDIHKVHLTWNRNSARAQHTPLGIDPKSVDWQRFLGNAPEQPFDEYRFRHWRWFWDFGGGLFTDLMVHWIDAVHWLLDLDHPAEAVSIGDHFMAKDVWETPDTVQMLLRYPDRGLQVYFEGTFVNARNAAMIEIMGSEATLYLDRGRYELHPEKGRPGYEEKVFGEGSRGADFYKTPDGERLHLENWLGCIRTRERPNTPAEAGVSAASAAHLANVALRQKSVARWTSAATAAGS